MSKKKQGVTIEIYGDPFNLWSFCIKAPNGYIYDVDQWYTERRKALRGAKRFVDNLNCGIVNYVTGK
jgi:hypothetical protein